MKKFVFFLLCLSLPYISIAHPNSVNVYAWSGVIPDFVIRQFENETGIKVNFSTYDNNETLYAKLKTNRYAQYDVIEPSSYYVDRMRQQNMLEKLDFDQLPNLRNINPDLMHQISDPKGEYSIPFIWGITGIFVNSTEFNPLTIHTWNDLWDERFKNKLMLLDDAREVFSIALLSLGYSANDTNPDHIKEAYLKLKTLLPNIKLFNSNAIISILIDEDAMIGMSWNGDLYKAQLENQKLYFIFPSDGFVIWVDNFAIPKNAPHRENAYRFINFIMRADVAKAIALDNNYPTANAAAQKLLPEEMRDNAMIYPPHTILKRGEFQKDVGDTAMGLYEKYWEQLKMGD